MSDSPRKLPVLFLPDVVLLPGMVVPVALDEAAQAAVDAAQSAGTDPAELLIAPRLDDRYATYGVITTDREGRPVQPRRPGRRAARRPARRDRQRRDRPRRGPVGRGDPRRVAARSPSACAS